MFQPLFTQSSAQRSTPALLEVLDEVLAGVEETVDAVEQAAALRLGETSADTGCYAPDREANSRSAVVLLRYSTVAVS